MTSALHQYELTIGKLLAPPSQTPLSLPSPSHPSRLAQSTSFGFPASYIRLPLAVLHVVMYMFQCYSIKTSHPLLLPLCTSLFFMLCSLCCPEHRLSNTVFVLAQLFSFIHLNRSYFSLRYHNLQLPSAIARILTDE